MILLFNQEDEEDVKLSMSETDLKEKYEGKLEKEMSGPVFETLSRIVKVRKRTSIWLGCCGLKLIILLLSKYDSFIDTL